MQKLSEGHTKIVDFLTCCVCNVRHTDICEVNLYQEYDLVDGKDIPTSMHVVICNVHACQEVMEKHECLYRTLPWSAGGPGRFILTCGPCKFRDEFACKHAALKENGGQGLEVLFTKTLLSNVRIHMSSGECVTIEPPATSCTGFEKAI